jgi:hypothetical protein
VHPSYLFRSHLVCILLCGHKRLHVPDRLSILIDTSVAGEETHPRNRSDRLRGPRLRVLKTLINERLCLDVRRKVIRDEIVISVLDNAVEQSRERLCVTKGTRRDGIKDG